MSSEHTQVLSCCWTTTRYGYF